MYTSHVKIEGYEVFPDGTVKLSALMKHMQQAAVDDLAENGATYESMLADDIVFVIIKMGIEFISPIRKDDVIDIVTDNTGTRGIIFIREFEITRGGELVARATTQWVLMSYTARKPVRPSILKTTKPSKPLETENGAVELPRKLNEGAEFTDTAEHTVRYSELDQNRHMNNTVYADLVCDYGGYVPHKPVRACRIYYNSEAVLGDVLDISVARFAGESGHALGCVNRRTGRSCFDAEIYFAE